jgi:hypothetical protein
MALRNVTLNIGAQVEVENESRTSCSISSSLLTEKEALSFKRWNEAKVTWPIN